VPKSRVLTSIPTELYQRVKRAAEERRTYQTELLLDAFGHHHEALREEFAAQNVRPGLPPRPRPRRRHLDQGVSACVLFLSDEEREIIDNAALELEMSRSAYVSMLFERELGGAAST
jgi:hypothetical protein